MEPKKISFGFSKIQKKSNIFAAAPSVKEENKVELIKCLEGQTIQLVEEKPVEVEKPLVIPLKESTRTSAALASLKARYEALNGITSSQPSTEDPDIADKPPPPQTNENETLEQKAARELLDSINKTDQAAENDTSEIAIPKPDELPLDGAKESSMDDYESTPIEKFGFAMLRGMGWKEEPKKKDDKNDLMEPFVRPKGMGLGADKIAKKKPPLIAPESNETLEIKRNACVRILAGKHKDLYGMIEGFDEHAGRVIVKLALGGHFESLNEFLVQPVSKKEYAQYGKVINSAKYEEYKKRENEHGQIVLKAPKIEKNSDSDAEDRKPVIKQGKRETKPTSSRRHSSDDSGDDQRDRRDNKRRDDNTQDRRNERKVDRREEYTRDRRGDDYRRDNRNDRQLDRRDDRTSNQIRDRRDDDRQPNRRDRYNDDRRRNNVTERQRSSSIESLSSETSSDDDRRHRAKKKSSKSSKSKKKHKERNRDRSRSAERNRRRNSSSEDEKRHKKKTKKSKRPRSRSRERKR